MRTPDLLLRLCIMALLILHSSGCQSGNINADATGGLPTTGDQAYAKNPDAPNPGTTLAEIPPGVERIAVILPQHGKLAAAGTALQRGMLIAWFNARENDSRMPALRFYDSSRADFAATYDAAVADGAQLVIGPLEKEHLRLLQQRSTLPVPTLALNYPDSGTTPANMYYIGLAGEDEATQIARTAAAENLRRIAILYPAADWGQRIARQFEQTLQENGGRVQARGTYQGEGDYDNVVRQLLDVGPSEQRHSRLERLLGTRLAFQPRRRQDIDGLLVIANTAQATQIAPAIQFHYGGGVPVFATSHINSQMDAGAAADLNGIRFVDMPWVINKEEPLRLQAEGTWKSIDERYVRLYALGIDALRVSGQMATLAGDPSARMNGVTGRLSMDSQRKIHRLSSWMVFRDGRTESADETTH